MENTKPKMEPYQKVLMALSWAFLVVATVFLVLQITDACPSGFYLIALGLSTIFNCCAQWKQRPIFNTVFIGLWCFLIGLALGLMMFR